MLELSLLGGFEVRSGRGEPIALPTRKARALLAYLALNPDEAVSRSSLAALLWSDRGEPQANNSLSQAVSAIRKALAGVTPSPLIVEPDSLKIEGSAVTVDVLAFDALSRSDDLGDLDRAEGIYRGELLEGIGVRDPTFEDWLEFERRRLHALAVGALTKLLDLRRDEGQRQELVATAERLLKLDPLQEAAHRALMRCYVEQGQIGLALTQYETCAEVLKRELGVEPDGDTKRVREAIVGQRPASLAVPITRENAAAASAGAEPEDTTAMAAAGETPTERWMPVRRFWGLAGMLLLLASGAVGIWIYPQERPPQRPTIVVLPFTNISGDPEQEYFADGMAEDIITDLSKISGLFIIARNSSFSYKGKQVTVRQVAEDLGVRYVLEGSVRRAGEQVRINAQLIDATTGGHLWAERFDGTLADVFAFQDQVTKRIVNALALQLTPLEVQKVGDVGTDNVAAHDAYLLGLSYYNRRTPEDNATARDHFEEAIRIDPEYSAAYTALARVYAHATIGRAAYSQELGIAYFHGYAKAWRLLDQGMSKPNADYHVLRSWLALKKHQHDRAIDDAEQALELTPNDAEAMEALAEALIYAGQPKEGIELAKRAIRQNPTSLGRALYLMGTAEFALGNPAKARDYLNRAMRQAPKEAYFAGIQTAVYGELGQIEQAKAAVKYFEQQGDFPTGTLLLGQIMSLYPFSDPDVLARLANGFKAGGVSAGVGGYLPLHKMNKLSGSEIKSLLFGKEIKGHWFWADKRKWRQRRATDGRVKHFGWPFHLYVKDGDLGVGRIRNDMLCEQWADLPKDLEICVVIFRVSERNARIRWGDYVMVTETGPQPFRLVE